MLFSVQVQGITLVLSPLSKTWMVLRIYLLRALSMTFNVDCCRAGAAHKGLQHLNPKPQTPNPKP